VAQERPPFRVIGGRRKAGRPAVSPFIVFGLVVVASMMGIVVARTSLDEGAFRLASLDARLAAEEVRAELLTLQAARLESPTRIAPLAEELGLVLPTDRGVLLVEDGSPATDDVFDGGQVAMGSTP
jgi:hypothetical protein